MFAINSVEIKMILLIKLVIGNADFPEPMYPTSLFYHEDFSGVTGCSPNRATPCPVVEVAPSYEDRVLFAHPHNCSLFYKCDWREAVLFECPEDLHFNNYLQTCDWPWEAGCDQTWTKCPRPRPICPARHPTPVYLPHPQYCNQFYQCSWGKPHLQTCPTGLHFDQSSKVCDWPHIARCNVC